VPINATDVVRKFAKKAHPNYVKAFEDQDGLLTVSKIDRPLRLAHFMAQCMHETGGLTILVENGAYTAKNLAKMWDSGNWHKYFADRAACIAMADKCTVDKGEALFNLVYGGRMGNGPPQSGDGWRYRGRGVLQTTGRESYRRFGKQCKVDFEGEPDLIFAPEHALKPALAEWDAKNLNVAADHNDIEVITLGINGGSVGLPERRAWFAKIWPYVSGSPAVEKTIEWRVQDALNKAGFDCGKPDGDIGPQTRTAIIAYRTKNGLTLRPDISDDLLRSLGL
jgi:putative chitinase